MIPFPTPPQRHWRVFYTLPRAEKKCEARIGKGDIEVFLPTHTVLRQWSDRKKKVVEPLFRNYLFAHVDERERLRVLEAPGIVRCVSFERQPALVPPEEIAQLRLVVTAAAGVAVLPYPIPARGARVRIEEGALEGLEGEVLRHRNQVHLIVRIDSIRQALKVDVPAASVRILRARQAA